MESLFDSDSFEQGESENSFSETYQDKIALLKIYDAFLTSPSMSTNLMGMHDDAFKITNSNSSVSAHYFNRMTELKWSFNHKITYSRIFRTMRNHKMIEWNLCFHMLILLMNTTKISLNDWFNQKWDSSYAISRLYVCMNSHMFVKPLK